MSSDYNEEKVSEPINFEENNISANEMKIM